MIFHCHIARITPSAAVNGRALGILFTATNTSSMDVQGLSISTANNMGVHGVSLSTASSMDVKGVSISAASGVDVQGVLLSIAGHHH